MPRREALFGTMAEIAELEEPHPTPPFAKENEAPRAELFKHLIMYLC